MGSRYFRLLQLKLLALAMATSAHAEPKFVRWTLNEDTNSNVEHVISVINQKTGFNLSPSDFVVQEDRRLATSHYLKLAQVAGGVPLRSMRIRLWRNPENSALIQAEANVESNSTTDEMLKAYKSFDLTPSGRSARFTGAETMSMARQLVSQHRDDRMVRNVTWLDQWSNGRLVRTITVKGRRGVHTFDVDLRTESLISRSYSEFPQSETSVRAMVYPIYERTDSSPTVLPRKAVELKYIKSQVIRSDGDPYASLRTQRYLENMYDPVLGETDFGRSMGFWSMGYIRRTADSLRDALPLAENSFANGGLVLEGRYATINLHANVPSAFQGLNFTPGYSAQFKPDWREAVVDGNAVWELVPMGSLRGRPLMSAEEALTREARVHPEHDPVTYINDGFDELQVYYAVNAMFDHLRPMGFADPDLAERPFHAFLYDPDISMRDNAYYTDDTINFTTYSPGHPNFARDNPTIWHELGHGVMDRMMGSELDLADTGGLSEGMADFVAQLVVQAESAGERFPGDDEFRIINNTGFFLTNEVHDDGESYGGAMNDLLVAAMRQHGRAGLHKVTDLVLEAMRLTRDHPALTAMDWFEHIIFADSLGREGVRAKGEMRDLIVAALQGRNFPMNGGDVADFTINNVTRNEQLTSTGPGSRENPIRLTLASDAKAEYELALQTKSTTTYQFKYPVTVKISLNGGPIQGAVRWDGESEYPKTVTLNSDDDIARVKLAATGACDFVNNDDGSCKDFAYIHVINNGDTRPVSKKRFYLRVKPAAH